MTASELQINELTQNGIVYTWRVNRTDWVLDIYIQHKSSEGQVLRIGYNYQTSNSEPPEIEISDSLLTKTIIFALKQGWLPTEPGLVDFVIYGEEVDP
ncbi:MAG: hypothetical protein OEZ68_03745 [Gammaproteobacteria bacterium]|nr:hypothetical protein [Gammaproteobacteria bacterium]MDH5799898.1 hypothetical protein [Gammaproteobacteria bacterium]